PPRTGNEGESVMMLLHTALWLMLGVAQAGAVAPPAAVQAPRPPDGESVLLWPKGAPGSEGKTAPESVNEREGVRRIASIHKPSLNVYLPAKGTATGAAVIIMPGGGHRYLAIDNEGDAVARWLS